MGRIRVTAVVTVLCCSFLPLRADDAVDFGRKIRPLLADKCFVCHGLDEKHREGGLRLDVQEGLYGKAESGEFAVVPNSPDQSALWKRISATDDTRMPPADSGKSLTPEEAELVRSWIAAGAPWKQHWSLVAPVKPEVPEPRKLEDTSEDSRSTILAWSKSPIDRFILNRLGKEGLKPSPEADREALLRRVTLDLTGLPPSPSEIREFVADQSANAYEKVVDRLLASPHYGEHMARFWLDAARYGDTHGLHLDNYRVMWPYRDWVVRSFNSNMPFDQFTIEQLAGDLLPNPTQDQIVATGFNRCNVTTSEGGALPEEYEVYYTNDRVATMSTVWMGLNMGCVTCHESKFDPFEMKDFYQLYAFFNNLDGPVMDGNAQDTAPFVRIMTDEQKTQLASMDQKINDLTAVLTNPCEPADIAQKHWEQEWSEQQKQAADWCQVVPEKFASSGGATIEKLEDSSLLFSGVNAPKDTYEVSGTSCLTKVTAVRLEGLTHPSLSHGGAGRSENSNVVLSEFEVDVCPVTDGEPQWKPAKLVRAWADHEQPDGNFRIANAIDGKLDTGWAINGHNRRENRVAIFQLETPECCDNGVRIRVRLKHESIFAQHQFGRIRISTTSADKIPQMSTQDIPGDIVAILGVASDKRDEKQAANLREFFRSKICTEPLICSARDELVATKKSRMDLESSLPLSLVWKEKPELKPAYILTRGAYNKPGAEVFRNTPAALPPLTLSAEGAKPTRLDLAKWLVSPQHPLTARVIVNRFWQQYFGTGIVETSEDFGSQGSVPSHPELLDWLAVDFRESGWDVKRLQRMIVTSTAYRQSSKLTDALKQTDPRNRLIARGPRYRLDGESIRDLALCASGLLVDRMGGPSVKPYQPEGIWEAVAYTDSNTAKFQRDTGEALYRRSLYTFWKRTAPPPSMVTFDAPSRETCTVRRQRTNTPLAALTLMNDEQFVEASRAMGQRLIQEGGSTPESRIDLAFVLTVGRHPTTEECNVVQGVLNDAIQRYTADPEAATKLIVVGESKPDPAIDPQELAAWTMVSNLLLNLDETVTK